MHELVPDVPLRHGHAISIDMAYSATLANQRGLLSDDEHRRILNLFSRAGLSMDHSQFDEEILDKGTKAILKTRDGKLRAAVPHPIGSCVFLNDVTEEELNQALRTHKRILKSYPREGAGLEAFVDASDTGYTMNDVPAEHNASNGISAALKKTVINDDVKSGNGSSNDLAVKHAAGADKDGLVNGNSHVNGANGVNGTNGHVNGHK
nr:2-epi-5-epi-valiolone synthase [Quercus suber]